MSSDSDDETPRVRQRSRPGTPDRERTTERVRGRRRRMNITDEEPAPAPRDVMDPGPTINWPERLRDEDGEIIPEAIQSRIRNLRAIDAAAATEFILETLHMLLLQHRAADDIARIFGVSVRTVWNWRKKLRERMSEDFRARIPTDVAAEQIANIKRTKALAWQQASLCREALDKLRWVTLTLKCEQELSAIYDRMKMYKAVDPRHDVDLEAEDNVVALGQLSEVFLTGGYAEASDTKKTGKKKKATPSTEFDDSDLNPEIEESDVMSF